MPLEQCITNGTKGVDWSDRTLERFSGFHIMLFDRPTNSLLERRHFQQYRTFKPDEILRAQKSMTIACGNPSRGHLYKDQYTMTLK